MKFIENLKVNIAYSAIKNYQIKQIIEFVLFPAYSEPFRKFQSVD